MVIANMIPGSIWFPPSVRTVFWVGLVAEVILVAYSLYLYASLRKRRWARGDDAVGYGCAWQIFWFFSAAAVVLAIGLMFSWRWVIAPIASCTLVTAVMMVYGLIAEAFKAWRKSRG